MTSIIKPGWSKPSTILFAAELPAYEKAFGFALAEATEFGADLIILHAYGRMDSGSPEGHGGHCEPFDAGREEKRRLEPLADRARDLGIHSRIVARPGLAADQILAFLGERRIDRVIMGAHSPGPIGKLLVGSVAEAVLRCANVPVCIVGPNVAEESYRKGSARNILCDVSKWETRRTLATFGAELAARRKANLILQQVIEPHELAKSQGDQTVDQLAAELPLLVSDKLHGGARVQTRVTVGDPTEELLYQGRARKASLIVLGAQEASHFAAITRAGTVYKVLAYAPCPVMTLSPVVLAACVTKPVQSVSHEENYYMAGVV